MTLFGKHDPKGELIIEDPYYGGQEGFETGNMIFIYFILHNSRHSIPASSPCNRRLSSIAWLHDLGQDGTCF